MHMNIMMMMKTARCNHARPRTKGQKRSKKRSATNAANRREINVNEPVTGIYKVNQIKPIRTPCPTQNEDRGDIQCNETRKKMEEIGIRNREEKKNEKRSEKKRRSEEKKKKRKEGYHWRHKIIKASSKHPPSAPHHHCQSRKSLNRASHDANR